MTDLDRIEALCAAATPGPWTAVKDPDGAFTIESDFYAAVCWREPWPENAAKCIADAMLIASARTDLPALVAEVRRLRAALSQSEYFIGERGLWNDFLDQLPAGSLRSRAAPGGPTDGG